MQRFVSCRTFFIARMLNQHNYFFGAHTKKPDFMHFIEKTRATKLPPWSVIGVSILANDQSQLQMPPMSTFLRDQIASSTVRVRLVYVGKQNRRISDRESIIGSVGDAIRSASRWRRDWW